MYERFRGDPEAVDPAWRELFANGQVVVATPAIDVAPVSRGNGAIASPAPSLDHPFGVWPLVHAYRAVGHQIAQLDPLELLERPHAPELDPAYHGFTDADHDRVFATGGLIGAQHATLREVIDG